MNLPFLFLPALPVVGHKIFQWKLRAPPVEEVCHEFKGEPLEGVLEEDFAPEYLAGWKVKNANSRLRVGVSNSESLPLFQHLL